ncbi:MAG: tRNA pseudouridine(38-40) synthase TruA [Myxococcales bacterium]|nr:tRNA pseudouridine(38-40) synthase TruA [Myxococcales bacterium]
MRLVVEYDGTAFSGWQIQEWPSAPPTIQGALEHALRQFTGEPIRVRGASRTDAGVHARGQVAVFVTGCTIPVLGFERGLRAYLPPDVVIRRADEVSVDWDPRRSSRGKRYIYSFWNDSNPTAIDRCRTWWIRAPLDIERMQVAAAMLLGTHNFAAFRAAGCVAKHAVRTMYAVNVYAQPECSKWIRLEVVGNAFVRNMVRIFAGTIMEVGTGRRIPEAVEEALIKGERKYAGVTAPPQGLCLDEVIYDERLPARPPDDSHVDMSPT